MMQINFFVARAFRAMSQLSCTGAGQVLDIAAGVGPGNSLITRTIKLRSTDINNTMSGFLFATKQSTFEK